MEQKKLDRINELAHKSKDFGLTAEEKEEQALLTTIAGLVVALMMIISEISNLFETIKRVFGF